VLCVCEGAEAVGMGRERKGRGRQEGGKARRDELEIRNGPGKGARYPRAGLRGRKGKRGGGGKIVSRAHESGAIARAGGRWGDPRGPRARGGEKLVANFGIPGPSVSGTN
jgi:hypothetical protein